MKTSEIKNKIFNTIDAIDDNVVLEEVLTYLTDLKTESKSNEEIVAYTIKGKPISRLEYINRNEKAVESFKSGKFKTQKQIIEKYKKSSI